MNTQTPSRPGARLTLRDWIDAMPIVILARALVSAFGDREDRGAARRAVAQIA